MYNVVLVIHVLVALSLIGIILIQRGRSGGLVEALGGVESIFGTKTSSFFVKLTVVLAILFFMTSISLAYISKQKGRSLFSEKEAATVASQQPQEEPLASGSAKPVSEQPKP
ncbi:MAG: preprotein translocase subunit SecG [Candidatus Omnitrophica bacterium]|nr:preprotein translocase subunit SecG [Candidatus Omnitrophota bacterium]MBU2044369.1 preprotein translocase subunit SecG [Candidatus Omnitrophota bacterium]MBU2251526.1 preprotein translocase subunit SecG [Candidatus Omnitrophota bacterium]MBU2266145.1 preprotein translocase subunit SecG [Candidatus Omnitrophota bacterium]MBU2473788.1 preprotein translocase subunit SecG [Candidatus Omnitrophota bacterium]